MSHSIRFANAVHCLAAETVTVDHLKLQKLVFYSYGAAWAAKLGSEVGTVPFSPWKHGPVNRELYDLHKGSGAALLPAPVLGSSISSELSAVIRDVAVVYGGLSSWALRCESHLEQPWRQAYAQRAHVIPDASIIDHFERKFAPNRVQAPVYYGRTSSSVDGIPSPSFGSLHELAQAVRANTT